MRWRDGRRSQNVEDMRGRSDGGGIGGMGAKFGVGTLVLMAAAYFLGIDPRLVMGVMQATQGGLTAGSPTSVETSVPQDEEGQFMAVILADTEDTWSAIFAAAGQQYTPPRLRLYEGGTRSGCGSASAEMGPFYCPADQRVYIDLNFYQELAQRFQAPGDFAQAYVLAHEVGHHVQYLTGIEERVRQAQQRASKEEQNALQVRMELQADCFAGIWANHANRSRSLLEAGDIDEGLAAAAAVGDDTLQKQAQGYVVPESFTHGSAAQRQNWFQRGYRSGAVADCDTFGARSL
ncbi:MAG: neutral zinc metallopeptidase [Steroidobacteraceae bacterium]